jgi:hypothetical protein
MKNFIVTGAFFFCASISSFGSEGAEKLENTIEATSTTKSSSTTQRALENSPTEKLETAFAQVSKRVGKELKRNGINTRFMDDKHEPNIEMVKKEILSKFSKKTPKIQNLIELTYHYWKFKELSDAFLKAVKSSNFIDYDPIHKAVQDGLRSSSSALDAITLSVKLSPTFCKYYIRAYLPKDGSLLGYFCQLDGTAQGKICKLIAVSGPNLPFTSRGDEKRTLYWEEEELKVLGNSSDDEAKVLGVPQLQRPFTEHVKEFRKSTSDYFKDIVFSDEKNISNLASEKYFLNSLFNTYKTAISLRYNGFDFSMKDVGTDIPAEEIKLQRDIAKIKLENKYLKEKLKTNNDAQLTNEPQNMLLHSILENKAKIYALKNCPKKDDLKVSFMKNYKHLEHLQQALASLEELSQSAICVRMEENMKLFISTCYEAAKKG